MEDRYEAVGLRNNPFAAPGPDGIRPDVFVSRGLADPPPSGSSALIQVIGHQGAGKTTHVQHWRSLAPGPYHYIPRSPYRLRWARPPVEDLVYGDEIDRMPVPLRRRWFKALRALDATVVIGTHADLSRLGRRYGFNVTTHYLRPIDKATLSQIIETRLGDAALEPERTSRDSRFSFDASDLDLIFRKSRGSLREAEVLCHELLADRVR